MTEEFIKIVPKELKKDSTAIKLTIQESKSFSAVIKTLDAELPEDDSGLEKFFILYFKANIRTAPKARKFCVVGDAGMHQICDSVRYVGLTDKDELVYWCPGFQKDPEAIKPKKIVYYRDSNGNYYVSKN